MLKQPHSTRRCAFVLYETQNGRTVFEYDLPSSVFGQFGDDRVTDVGRKLDRALESTLLKAAT